LFSISPLASGAGSKPTASPFDRNSPEAVRDDFLREAHKSPVERMRLEKKRGKGELAGSVEASPEERAAQEASFRQMMADAMASKIGS
jgi:hypothetical protein